MCFNWFMMRKYGIDKPKNTVDISCSDLQIILQDQLKNDEHPLACILDDHRYKLAPKSEYQRMIRYDNTNTMLYEKDYLDCDDYSARLHGAFCIPGWSALAVGEVVCWTGTDSHMVNCFVDSDKQVWILEPQSDQYWKPQDKDWKYFSVEMS